MPAARPPRAIHRDHTRCRPRCLLASRLPGWGLLCVRLRLGRPPQQIIRQIKTVLIEVSLCDNPPGLDGTPSFCKAHVNLQLIKSRSATGRNLLHRLWWGLKETGAKLANGRKVFNRNDAVVWLIEQLQERL